MAKRPEKGEISKNKQMAMIVVLVLFISSALPQVTLGNVSRDHWPHLGAPVTQDLLDELVYDDILNKPLAVGFFLRGAAGPKGPDGPRGPSGTQGVQGYTGLPGATGPKGKQGPPGIIGPRGPPGLHGLQGTKGMRGPMGPPGPSGAPGTQGAPGSTGGAYSPALVLVINTTTICEGGNDALLCGDKKIIKITQAFWGRDNYYTCAQPPSSTMTSNQLTQMDPDHVTRTLKYRCTNKQNCPISANRLTFGDTSDPTVAKYLRVWYECIPDHRDFLMKDNVVRRYRRDIARSKEKREFFLPVIDKTKEKNEHSRDVSETEKEWDKSNEQSNKTTERTKIEKRQNSRRDNAKLSHILNELLHPASSLPT